jgi:hypothetical protein
MNGCGINSGLWASQMKELSVVECLPTLLQALGSILGHTHTHTHTHTQKESCHNLTMSSHALYISYYNCSFSPISATAKFFSRPVKLGQEAGKGLD